MTSSIARADAAFHEQVHRQWRDWHTFLTCQLTLLDARDDLTRVAFERAESRQSQAADAERQLARLPPPQRTLFESICEERRQQVTREAEQEGNGRTLDPDASERVALAALLAEADGTAEGADRTNGWGDVPLQLDGGVQWYRVHVAALRDAPVAAAYTVGAGDADDMRRRIALAGLLGAGVVVFLAVWFLWPRGQQQRVDDVVHGPTGNGVPAAVWPIRSISILTPEGDTTIAIIPTTAQQWAANSLSTGQWQTDTFAPVRLCLPSATLIGATRLHIGSNGQFPERDYQLVATKTNAVDLEIDACNLPDKTVFGTLQHTAPMPTQVLVEAVALDATTTITVSSITIASAAQEPLLPPDRARVLVEITGPALDWPAYAPTLTLANGTATQTPEQLTTVGGVQLRYLVPLPVETTHLVWSLTSPLDGTRHQWRITLAPPPSRAVVLAEALEVRSVTPQRDEDNAQLALQLELTNQGRVPLQLTPADMIVMQSERALPIPDLAALRTPLDAGETRLVVLPVPGHPAAPLELTVGSARYAITIP